MDQDPIRTYNSKVSPTTLEVDPISQPKAAVFFTAQGDKKAISCALSLADARALAEHLLSIPEIANAAPEPEPMTTATVLGLIRNRAQDDHGACGQVHAIVDLFTTHLDQDYPVESVAYFMARIKTLVVNNLTLGQTGTILSWARDKVGFEPGNQSTRENTIEAIGALVRLLVPELCAPAAPLTTKTGPIEVGDIVTWCADWSPLSSVAGTNRVTSLGIPSRGNPWVRVRDQRTGHGSECFRHATPAEIAAFNEEEENQ